MVEDVKNGIVVHNFQQSHGQKIHPLAISDFGKLNRQGFEDVEKGLSENLLGLKRKSTRDIKVYVIYISGLLDQNCGI